METSNHCFYIVMNIFIFDCVLLIDFEWKNETITTVVFGHQSSWVCNDITFKIIKGTGNVFLAFNAGTENSKMWLFSRQDLPLAVQVPPNSGHGFLCTASLHFHGNHLSVASRFQVRNWLKGVCHKSSVHSHSSYKWLPMYRTHVFCVVRFYKTAVLQGVRGTGRRDKIVCVGIYRIQTYFSSVSVCQWRKC